jgi:hypothetical protein
VAKKAKVVLPVAPLPDLMAWWHSQQTRGILIGGLAASLLGRPRVTRDLDAMVLVPEDEWATFLDAGKPFGFVPRVAEALEFSRQSRVLLLRHERTGIDVDVALGCLPFEEEAVSRAVAVTVAGVDVPLATPEDLIVMKAMAQRDQDWLDIDGLLAAHPATDMRRVRRWLRSFADALEAPDVYDDFEKYIARRKRRKRKA